jgi:hypothetical protein
MTYVPNTITIATHRVDWWHHGIRIGERKLKSPMKTPQGEKRKMMKEREEEERERGATRLLMGQSSQLIRRDWSHTMLDGMTHGCDSAIVVRGDTVAPIHTQCT